jgi:type II secretory pathway predicted ATPase ExeA
VYESYFGLRAKPFSILPDPACIFPGRSHRATLAVIEHAVAERTGFSLITGDIGTGKTTLVRSLTVRQMRGVAVGYIANPHASFGPLLGRALIAFGVEAPDGQPLRMIDQFQLLIEELAKSGRRALLIVDEAQVLGSERLEELRMLSNIVAEDCMLHVVLVGLPGLRDTLKLPELRNLAQRLAGDCELHPLDREETHRYIAYRLAHAGAKDTTIFDEAACDAVHVFTGGIPRLINILCEDALTMGAISQRKPIDVDLVRELALERQRGGILPLHFGESDQASAPYPMAVKG